MASIPDSLEFLMLKDIGLVEGASDHHFDASQKSAMGMIDSDPTGLTSGGEDFVQINEPWGSPHGEGTGEAIAICNGMNTNHCTEAADVVRHRLRRPGKMAARGDPDYVEDPVGVAVRPATLVTTKEPVTAESGSSEVLP